MSSLFHDLAFTLGALALLLGLLALARLLLLAANRELAAGIPAGALRRSFLIGARFDLIIGAALLLPPTLLQLFSGGDGIRLVCRIWLLASGSLALFFAVLELEFYRHFHTRLNRLFIDYLKEDPQTVTSMIWHGCPVLRYLTLWLALALLCHGGLLGLDRLWPAVSPADGAAAWFIRAPLFTALLLFLLIAVRGTLRQGPPLRWGDAFHSPYLFANHLALNGIFTLVKALSGSRRHKLERRWLGAMPATQARALTRRLLEQPGCEWLNDPEKPILRHQRSRAATRPWRNLVVILMESFSGRFTGALGAESGITPAFDQLAADGVLFDHFFSNGTHTHQGAFATLAGFPNLPGFETLMQQPEGAAPFSGLADHLKPRGLADIYIYNGDFAWDNQQGFFRNQGMSCFIGRYDYEDPEFIDPTWGVSDHDMFNRARQELERLATAEKPFFAILQTLSNHLPFTIPEPLPVAKVEDQGRLNGQLTAMRYADWALGEFFRGIENRKWFAETLFVLLGDHGFCVPQQLTEIDLLRFHVPLLFYGPGLGLGEAFGRRRSTVATQVDVVPTILGLKGETFTHQSWGRDLFHLAPGDPGSGLIKPSGSDPTVALLKGEKLLILPPEGSPARLYRYTLQPEPEAWLHDDPALTRKLTECARAYIGTALRVLRAGQTGI